MHTAIIILIIMGKASTTKTAKEMFRNPTRVLTIIARSAILLRGMAHFRGGRTTPRKGRMESLEVQRKEWHGTVRRIPTATTNIEGQMVRRSDHDTYVKKSK
jgi:hypothetical protein